MGRRADLYGESRGSKRGRRSIFRIVAKALLFVVTILAAVVLALTLMAPNMNPEWWWGFPVLGVVAPAVYLFNFILSMVWIMLWRWRWALPSILLMILGLGKVTNYVKMDFSTHYGEASYRGMVKFMSYNLRGHINDDKEWSTTELSKYIDSIAPDILCVQELKEKKFEKELPAKFKDYHKAVNSELGIYSKYPIVASSPTIKEQNLSNVSKSMWADIKISEDTIRVFNNHLISTMIKEEDDKYLISREFLADSLAEDKLTDIISRFKSSSELRAQHADSLASIIASSPYRVIVCGDFNDTPMSYTYRAISEGLNDSFRECGVGYPYTYRGFLNTMRIDYILASEGVEFKSYRIDSEITYSDHLPVITHFILTK